MHFLPSSRISLLAYWLLRAILSFPSIGLLCDRQTRPDWRHRWVETQRGKAERSHGNTAVIDISDHLAVPANFSEDLVKWGKVKYRLRQWEMRVPKLINQLGETDVVNSVQVEYYSAVWWQRWTYPDKSPKMFLDKKASTSTVCQLHKMSSVHLHNWAIPVTQQTPDQRFLWHHIRFTSMVV